MDRTYRVDSAGFLLDPDEWDEGFAEGATKDAKIPDGLTEQHWQVINWIRNYFKENGRCPLVYEVCKALQLSFWNLKELFPAGYQRGACKLAGLTYYQWASANATFPSILDRFIPTITSRKYTTDVNGFLTDPGNWDEQWAAMKADEMRYPGHLTEKHWEIIRFLRERFQEQGVVPTVYDTCESNRVELEELERLFPTGYHRGAVKLAGLRLW